MRKSLFMPLMPQVLAVLLLASAASAQQPIAIAIHGGAGTIKKANLTAAQEQAYMEVLNRALDIAYGKLHAGAQGLDVVVETIVLLEDSPLFNAGYGAVLTHEGTHELDAAIMDGATLQAGAVAGVRSIKNPIQAARAVMQHSPHVMLAGSGADAFAATQGLELVDNNYFTTPRREADLRRFLESEAAQTSPAVDTKFGTVGVVVLDSFGNLAAGTSTGGMTGKRWGRIGDSPLIGAGTYANNASCAVSATGHGEYFIRYQVASDICARVEYLQESLQRAAQYVIENVLLRVGGDGGVVAVDSSGNVATVFNTEGMYRASIDANGRRSVAIYRESVTQADEPADTGEY